MDSKQALSNKLSSYEKHTPFPSTLYVLDSCEPEDSGKAPFDGYPGYQMTDDGDTIAVYQLVKVCLVREIRSTVLEEIENK
jgi:hypothetical protein